MGNKYLDGTALTIAIIGAVNWGLLDFGDVIVHVFDKENRLLYDLERIWRDGVQIPVEEL